MAEGGKNWEFDCPQFYDFCNGVEDNTKNSHYLGGDLPDFSCKFNLKSKNYMKSKLTTWNNKLSTPVNKSPFVNANRKTNNTDSEKLNEKKRRLSKSEGSINTFEVPKNVSTKQTLFRPGFTRKRSLSESDAKPKRKFPVTPKKVPATPACLKRTKNKFGVKKLKTSEELELEKIAELQRLTLKHLRLNEQAMKKMKLKPKPQTVPKIAVLKPEKREKSASVKEFQKDLEEVVKKLNSNRNMRFADQNRMKRERLKAVSCSSDLELPSSVHTLKPFVSSILNEVQNTVDETDIEREVQNSCSEIKISRNKENYFSRKVAPKTDVGYGQKSFKY